MVPECKKNEDNILKQFGCKENWKSAGKRPMLLPIKYTQFVHHCRPTLIYCR